MQDEIIFYLDIFNNLGNTNIFERQCGNDGN